MNMYRLLFAGVALVGLAACEGGGVDLKVSTTDNSVDNSQNTSGGGGSTNGKEQVAAQKGEAGECGAGAEQDGFA